MKTAPFELEIAPAVADKHDLFHFIFPLKSAQKRVTTRFAAGDAGLFLSPRHHRFPYRNYLVRRTDYPCLAAAGDAGDVQRPHMRMYHVMRPLVDAEVTAGVFRRRCRVGVAVYLLTGTRLVVPVVEKVVVEHGSGYQHLLVGMKVQTPIYPQAQLCHRPAVVKGGHRAVLCE